MKQSRFIVCLTSTAVVATLGLTGCRSGSPKEDRRQVTAADFAGPPANPSDTPAPRVASTPSPSATQTPATTQASPSTNSSQTATPEASAPLTLDAMVGQVNGRAIYARDVFDPVHDQLAALGRTLPPSIFRRRAAELVAGQLRTIVTNALILGEAERDLSLQERYGLVEMLKSRREELLRQFGSGSSAKADSFSIETTGKNVDQHVNEYREQLLVGRYIHNKVRPRIHVSRKDIERYYDTYRDKYNPPAGRTLRIIMTTDATSADHIDKTLAAGTPFAEVAGQSLNQYRASSGGMWPSRIVGDKFSGFEPLNQAMLKLKQGEQSSRIEAGDRFWWIKLETYEDGKGRPLEQVQLEIRQILEDQQRNQLGLEFRQKLLDEGSYNPIDQMTEKLVDIAMSRYSQPTP